MREANLPVGGFPSRQRERLKSLLIGKLVDAFGREAWGEAAVLEKDWVMLQERSNCDVAVANLRAKPSPIRPPNRVDLGSGTAHNPPPDIRREALSRLDRAARFHDLAAFVLLMPAFKKMCVSYLVMASLIRRGWI